MITRAVIPAAGLGTRLLPASRVVPKELLPLVDRPVIHWIVDEVVQAGIRDILIIVSRGKDAIADYFDHDPELERALQAKGRTDLLEKAAVGEDIHVHYVRQPEPRGLGHAVLMARSFAGEEPFALLLPDEVYVARSPALAQLIQLFDETEQPVVGLMKVPWADVNRYGIVAGDWTGERECSISDMVEKPPLDAAPSNVALCGRYVITPDIFDFLAHTSPGAGGEIQLTDGLRGLLGKRPIRGKLIDGERLDVGTLANYLEANLRLAMRHPEYGPALREAARRNLGDGLEV